MKYDLNKAQIIVENLQQELLSQKQAWESIKKLNPGWEQLSDEHWKDKQARCWLHGATDLLESNQLETWRFESPEPSETALSSAAHCVKYWREYLEIKDAYYSEFDKFELPAPEEGEILRNYIIRMARLVEDEGTGSRLEWRALKSFLAYMRKVAKDESAFIEQIFPFKIDIYYSRIIRLIEPEVYPIPQATAAEILKELARMCKYGRPNVRHAAAEALGLCWLCLSASRLRLPITLDAIYSTNKTSITYNESCSDLLVPTMFGNRSLKISQRVAQYLLALAKISSTDPRDTILQKPKRSLMRVLDKAIANVKPNPAFGNITFVTFISPPHIFGDNHRYVPKN